MGGGSGDGPEQLKNLHVGRRQSQIIKRHRSFGDQIIARPAGGLAGASRGAARGVAVVVSAREI